jgi:hypothetical protein
MFRHRTRQNHIQAGKLYNHTLLLHLRLHCRTWLWVQPLGLVTVAMSVQFEAVLVQLWAVTLGNLLVTASVLLWAISSEAT